MERLREYFIYIAVIVSGFTVMMLEILGARVLGPFFGTGIYAWSAQLTSAMLFLSLGYWIGGFLSAKVRNRLWAIFCSPFAFTSISFVLILLIAPSLFRTLIPFDLRIGALIASFALFGIPFFVLGSVSPLAIALLNSSNNAGKTSGKMFALSTVGSLVGTVVTAFLFIPNFSVRSIILAFSLIHFLLAILLLIIGKIERHNLILTTTILLASLLFGIKSEPVIRPETVLHVSQSLYGQVKVIEEHNKRWLLIDGSGQTAIYTQTGGTSFYYPVWIEAIKTVKPDPKKVLMVGLGGGYLVKAFSGAKIDVVEINPAIPPITNKFFGLDPNSYKLHLADGRTFFEKTEDHWDLIIMDAFAADSPTFHLYSKEALESAKSRLAPNGVLIINVLTSFGPKGKQVASSLVRTLAAVFPFVEGRTNLSSIANAGYTNLLLFASNSSLKLSTARGLGGNQYNLANIPKGMGYVLTDNYNPLDILYGLEASPYTRRDLWESFSLETLIAE